MKFAAISIEARPAEADVLLVSDLARIRDQMLLDHYAHSAVQTVVVLFAEEHLAFAVPASVIARTIACEAIRKDRYALPMILTWIRFRASVRRSLAVYSCL